MPTISSTPIAVDHLVAEMVLKQLGVRFSYDDIYKCYWHSDKKIGVIKPFTTRSLIKPGEKIEIVCSGYPATMIKVAQILEFVHKCEITLTFDSD